MSLLVDTEGAHQKNSGENHFDYARLLIDARGDNAYV